MRFQHYPAKTLVFVADQTCVMIRHFPVTCVSRRVNAPSDAAALQSLECSSEDLKQRPWITTSQSSADISYECRNSWRHLPNLFSVVKRSLAHNGERRKAYTTRVSKNAELWQVAAAGFQPQKAFSLYS